MTFRKLSEYFERLEKTSSRLEMTRILAEVFREATTEEIDEICYLSLGRLTPLYESLEFQLAEKMVVRSLALAFDGKSEMVAKEFKKVGDLGLVASELKARTPNSKLRTKNVTVLEVYKRLRQIAEDSGEGSQERKVNGLVELLEVLDGLSCKYLARMVVGKLRLGFSDKTMIDALSWMLRGDKSLRDEIEKAYFVRADIGALAQEIKKHKSIKEIKGIKPELGVPVMPALCQRLKTADEMIAKMGKVAVEPKWDGTRVQIHLSKTKENRNTEKRDYFLRTFTRNLEETIHMFPELKEAYKQVRADSVILDSEAVGMDPKTKKLLKFQQTMVRKRKHGIEEASRRVPLKFFVFDILYKDGQGLISRPLSERRKILEQVLSGKKVLQLTEQIITESPSELRQYHAEQLKQGLEGVVVKKLTDHYVPGRRGWSWVKFKEEEQAAGKLKDTLDCVVMGYYQGKGKRVQFGLGKILVGIRDKDVVRTFTKVGTGLTEEDLVDMKTRLDRLKVKVRPKEYLVDKNLEPDVWVEPKLVVEVAADEITKSPIHSLGVSLRFPKFIRFRDDKSPSQATSVAEVISMN